MRRNRIAYPTFTHLLDDAQRLVDADAQTLGAWSLGQILEHLARAFDLSCGRGLRLDPWTAPWGLRFLGRYVLKPWMLRRGMAPGFKLPAHVARILVSDPISPAEALAHLRSSAAFVEHADSFPPHPVLGPMTPAEWRLFHLRHAELHMSFVVR